MISTPFHPTPHSPSGGSERGLLSSLNKGEEEGNGSRTAVPSLKRMQDRRYIIYQRTRLTI